MKNDLQIPEVQPVSIFAKEAFCVTLLHSLEVFDNLGGNKTFVVISGDHISWLLFKKCQGT